MKSSYVAIFVLLSLLSQQLMAGVVSAAMMAPVASDQLSSSMGEMSLHHEMASEDGMYSKSDSQTMDCCATDCAYCIAGCYSVLSSQLLKQLPVFTQIPLQQSNSQPLVQSPESLFRPPIFA